MSLIQLGTKSRVLVAVFSLVQIHVSLAAEYRADNRAVIGDQETIEDDLYIFGNEIVVDGNVKGDLIAFGSSITLNGSVEGDFIAAGQSIVINGKVADDVRIAGQVLKLDQNADVADDLISAGFSLETAAAVGGDLIYSGYQAIIDGDTTGDVAGSMANCELRGKVGGDVNLKVSGDDSGAGAYNFGPKPSVAFPSVPGGLTIRETARVAGELKYESPEEARIESTAQISGGVEYDQVEPESTTLAERSFDTLKQYLSLLVVGMSVALIAPRWTSRLSEIIRDRPLPTLGWGVATIVVAACVLPLLLVMTVAAAVVSGYLNLSGLVGVFIVLGLSAWGVAAVGCWFLASYLSKVIVGLLIGELAIRGESNFSRRQFVLSLIIGLTVLASLSLIPYVGSLVRLLVIVFSFGALSRWALWRRRAKVC